MTTIAFLKRGIFFTIITLLTGTFSATAQSGISPTPYEYALMSQYAYDLARTQLPDGWEVIARSVLPDEDPTRSDRNGYFGVAFVNHEKRQVVIAHRGTENNSEDIAALAEVSVDNFEIIRDLIETDDERDYWPLILSGIRTFFTIRERGDAIYDTYEDLDDDVALTFFSQVPEQYRESAAPFNRRVATLLKNEGLFPAYGLSYTGHSLGAILAELSAIEGHSPAVTFESMGSAALIEKLAFQPAAETLEITIYMGAPNLFNTLKPQIGDIILIEPDWEATRATYAPLEFESYFGEYSLNAHNIGNLITYIDPVSGQPAYQLDDVQTWWPANIMDGLEQFVFRPPVPQ